MSNYKKFLFVFILASSGFFTNANANTADFKTNITYPNLFNEKVFGLLPNKLLFYSGQQDGKFVNGYYKSSEFLGWVNNKFQPLENYNSSQMKRIESVIETPDKNTLVLSTVEDVGQLLSNSLDGSTWQNKKIVTPTKFDTLVRSTNDLEVFAYGKKELLFFSTNNTENWYQWALPSGCTNKEYCTYENHYFNMSKSNYVLIQSIMINDVRTNTLYSTADKQYWTPKSLPFNNSKIVKVINGKFDTVFVQTNHAFTGDKLWLSVDFDGWVDFDLPKGAVVNDILVHNKNRIDLLLYYPYSGLPAVTEYVTLDTETKSFTVVQSFNGSISNLKLVGEKIYISGNFKNPHEEQSSLLASTNL